MLSRDNLVRALMAASAVGVGAVFVRRFVNSLGETPEATPEQFLEWVRAMDDEALRLLAASFHEVENSGADPVNLERAIPGVKQAASSLEVEAFTVWLIERVRQ